MAWGTKHRQSEEAERITQLRKSGDLKGAYSEARNQFARGNREESFMQSYTWVLHDCLKRYMTPGTKFHKDVAAFCSTLAQIRKFPVRAERDDLFIDQVSSKVLSVGWELRKEGNLQGLSTLATELCQWKRQSFLFNAETARLLLVGLKEQETYEKPVLSWLGLAIDSWDQAYSEAFVANLSNGRIDQVAIDGLAWAYYDDLKKSAGNDKGQRIDLDLFLRATQALGSINHIIGSNHESLRFMKKKLLHIGWTYRESKNRSGLEKLLEEVTRWPAGTVLHDTDVLTMFYVGFKDSPESLIRLVEWFGFDCLTPNDFIDRKVGDNSYPSTAQDLAKSYLEALLTTNTDGSYVATPGQRELGCSSVENLLSKPACSEWIWESYKLGKLQAELGHVTKARKRLAMLVASKPKEAWSWAAYGRTWQQEDCLKYETCVFMGLSVSRDLQTSLSVHEDAAKIFISKEMFDEARTEIETIASFRRASGWKTSEFIEEAQEQGWYSTSESRGSNLESYRAMSNGADEIVASDLPWTDFYVEWKNEEKGLVGIVTEGASSNSYNRSSIKDKELSLLVQEGFVYKGHIGFEGHSLIGPVEDCPESQLKRVFTSAYSGTLDLVKNFAFVRTGSASLWVSPSVLEGLGAKQFQNVSGYCRKVYREPKKPFEHARWEWEISTLTLGEEAEEETYRKQFSGSLELARNRSRGTLGFGFAAGCFIPAELISSNRLYEYDEIEFIAEKNWDSKKNRWGWSATKIINRKSQDYDEYEDLYEDSKPEDEVAAFRDAANWSDLIDGEFKQKE
ncbi:DUF7016 domain-containing protein [Paraeggerthella sp.]|uniref:DUF7017 domain-containing protein n=1 Tax=Paraeggerthella sp. TaxID=2897350 RepID=UPI0035284A1E